MPVDQAVIDVRSTQTAAPENREDQLLAAANEAAPGVSLPTARHNALRSWVFYAMTALVLVIGWHKRGHVYLSPEQGAGYLLGIVGGSLMLLLLLYPMRKQLRWMHGLGQVRHWFRAHMIMGVVGPVCILYHCNFQLGSTNGNIALFSMLLVAGSGLIGRYLYTRIHYGLYGRKMDLVRLGSDAATARMHMDHACAAVPQLKSRLQALEKIAVSQQYGLLASLARVLEVGIRTRWSGLVSVVLLRRALRNSAKHRNWTTAQQRRLRQSAELYLNYYLQTIRKVAGFSFYERLFSLWHILHLPLFLMLVLAGLVHVCAVHMY
jgi:hypothetical protein